MNETNSPLSPQGAHRRETILLLAGQALEGRMRRRRAKRGAIAALVLGLAAVGLLLRSNGAARRTETTDSKLVEAPSITHQLMSDEELVKELASVGIKAGLIRIGETVRLVADDGSEIKPPDRLVFPAQNQG